MIDRDQVTSIVNRPNDALAPPRFGAVRSVIEFRDLTETKIGVPLGLGKRPRKAISSLVPVETAAEPQVQPGNFENRDRHARRAGAYILDTA